MTRAPVAPRGWPSEMPPPFGLMSSNRSSSPASCANWSTTHANASFTSITEMSSHVSPARAERLPARLRVAVQHPVRVDAREAEGDEARPRLEAEPRRGRLARDEHGCGAVDDLARVAGGDDPVREKRRLERRRAAPRGVAPRRLVDADEDGCAGGTDLDRDDLVLEAPLVDRGDRSAVRLERVRVELLPARCPTPRRSPRPRSPAGRSASGRAACPRGRRRSSPSGRATSSRRPRRRRRRAAPTRPPPPR